MDKCGNCGGQIFTTFGPGRTANYRTEIDLPLPENFPQRTCSSCGTSWTNSKAVEELDAVLKPVYQRRVAEKIVKKLTDAVQNMRAGWGNDEFNALFTEAVDFLNVSERELANKFEVAISTITRWRRGFSKPTPGLQKVVYNHLLASLHEMKNDF